MALEKNQICDLTFDLRDEDHMSYYGPVREDVNVDTLVDAITRNFEMKEDAYRVKVFQTKFEGKYLFDIVPLEIEDNII